MEARTQLMKNITEGQASSCYINRLNINAPVRLSHDALGIEQVYTLFGSRLSRI